MWKEDTREQGGDKQSSQGAWAWRSGDLSPGLCETDPCVPARVQGSSPPHPLGPLYVE